MINNFPKPKTEKTLENKIYLIAMGKRQSKPSVHIPPPEIQIEHETPELIHTLSFSDPIKAFSFNSSTSDLIILGSNDIIYIYDGLEFKLKKELTYNTTQNLSNLMAITPNGEKLILANRNKSKIDIWDLKTHELIKEISSSAAYANDLQAYGDNNFITVKEGELRLWDLENYSEEKVFKVNPVITSPISVIQERKTCFFGLEKGYMKVLDSGFELLHHGQFGLTDIKLIVPDPSGNQFCTVENLSSCFKITDLESKKNYIFFNEEGSPKKIIFVNDWSFVVVFDKVIQYRTFPTAKIVKQFYIEAEDFIITPEMKCFAKTKNEIKVFQLKKQFTKDLKELVPGPNDIFVYIDTMTESYKVPISKIGLVSDLVKAIKEMNSAIEHHKIVLNLHGNNLEYHQSITKCNIIDGTHVAMFISSPQFERYK